MGSPDQIRTGVTGLRGRRPRPLDDGARRGWPGGHPLGGKDSNPQRQDQNLLCCQLHHPRMRRQEPTVTLKPWQARSSRNLEGGQLVEQSGQRFDIDAARDPLEDGSIRSHNHPERKRTEAEGARDRLRLVVNDD